MKLKWADFKSFIDNGDLPFREDILDGKLVLSSHDGTVVKRCYVENDIDDADYQDYNSNYRSLATSHMTPVDAFGLPKVSTEKPTGNFSTKISHNFCDNTTWAVSASDSTYELRPGSGEIMIVSKSEVQFIHDLAFDGQSLTLEYHAWVAPATTMAIEMINFTSILTLFEYGNEHFYSPAIGTEMPHGLTTVQFNQHKQLMFHGDEKLGSLAFLRVVTSGHTEIGGSYATASFVTETTSV